MNQSCIPTHTDCPKRSSFPTCSIPILALLLLAIGLVEYMHQAEISLITAPRNPNDLALNAAYVHWLGNQHHLLSAIILFASVLVSFWVGWCASWLDRLRHFPAWGWFVLSALFIFVPSYMIRNMEDVPVWVEESGIFGWLSALALLACAARLREISRRNGFESCWWDTALILAFGLAWIFVAKYHWFSMTAILIGLPIAILMLQGTPWFRATHFAGLVGLAVFLFTAIVRSGDRLASALFPVPMADRDFSGKFLDAATQIREGLFRAGWFGQSSADILTHGIERYALSSLGSHFGWTALLLAVALLAGLLVLVRRSLLNQPAGWLRDFSLGTFWFITIGAAINIVANLGLTGVYGTGIPLLSHNAVLAAMLAFLCGLAVRTHLLADKTVSVRTMAWPATAMLAALLITGGGLGISRLIYSEFNKPKWSQSPNEEAPAQASIQNSIKNPEQFLDQNLQAAARSALGDRSGAVVAIDPGDGRLLALVSSEGTDKSDDPYHMAVNFTLSPGATLKPFVALLGLESMPRQADQRFNDSGSFKFGGHYFHDNKPDGHGLIDMRDALVQSCDTYFFSLASDLGIDQMATFLDSLGLGKKTGAFDGTGNEEAAGVLPSQEWKRRRFKLPEQQRWYAGETLSHGIGQGYHAYTPIQLASAMATLASGGTYRRPHLSQPGQDKDAQGRQLKSENLGWNADNVALIHRALADFNKKGNGASNFANTTYEVAGMAGISHVFSVRNNAPGLREDHSLYLGFAPINQPRIALAVVIENSEDKQMPTATAIARKVFDAHLAKTAPIR